VTKAKRISMRSIRKEEIMNAALIVLSERGSANVTLDDIAKASGFSKGGITYYYASKEVLIRDVFEQFFEYIWERGYSGIRMNVPPLEKLEGFVWLYDEKDDQVNKIYPLLFDMLVLATYNDEYRETFQKWVHNWVNMTVEILEEGNSTGDFQVEDVQATAQLISATAQGIGIRWYLDRDHHTSEWAAEAFITAVHGIVRGKN
jgi:AcrR family transcriptional regulator